MKCEEIPEGYRAPLYPRPTGMAPRLTVLRELRCVLFDIYGTLFISDAGDIGAGKNWDANLEKLQSLLDRYEIKLAAVSLPKLLFSKIQLQHELLRASGIDFPEIQIERIWADILQIPEMERIRSFSVEYEMITNPVYPMPHLAETLTYLNDKKILLGIISNAQFFTPCLFEWYLKADAGTLGFSEALVFYSYRFEVAKPSPVLFEKAAAVLARLGIERHQVLYVGNDKRNDVLCAHSVGFRTCLFAGDARSLRLRKEDESCRNLEPDVVITELRQLLECI